MVNIKSELYKREVWTLGLIEFLIFTILISYLLIWTPLLLEVNQNTNIGMTFLTFTLSIIIFSKLFEVLILIKKKSIYEYTSYVLLLICLSLIIIYRVESFGIRLCLFAIINGSFGFLMPALSTLKSEFLKEKYRTLMMSVYKVPTYLLSIITILLTIVWSLDKVNFFILIFKFKIFSVYFYFVFMG